VETSVGRSGQFDVLVGDTVVATKRAVGFVARLLGDKGFPNEADAVAKVRAHLAGPGSR
jgi:hypothetical protein